MLAAWPMMGIQAVAESLAILAAISLAWTMRRARKQPVMLASVVQMRAIPAIVA